MSESGRFERKFVFSETRLAHARAAILRAPGEIMRQAFAPRYVNNLYLDTRGFDACRENLDGIADRRKYRVRWYGDFFGSELRAVLEIKVKNALAGSKIAKPFKTFSLMREFSPSAWPQMLQAAGLDSADASWFKSYRPVLFNRYRREYFQSSDGVLRVTLDRDIRYFRWSASQGITQARESGEPYGVLELKYSPEAEKRAARSSQCYGLRLSRHSKYVRGVEATRSFF
jgi:SPX domain protein involved in polyphosphate accumulation